MVAKRNADVEKLNAMAREVRTQAGQLGAQEIEVGEAKFAAGDQIITRVNDRSADIYNRERWRIAEVDAEQGGAVLEGIDQAAGRSRSRLPGADQPALRGPGARTCLRRHDLLGAGLHLRAGLRHGRPLDGQARAIRRRLPQPRGDLPLRDAGGTDPPRGDRAGVALPARGHPAHRRSRRARPRPDRRPRGGARSQFSGLPTEELVARRAELRPPPQRERWPRRASGAACRSGSSRPASTSRASRPSARPPRQLPRRQRREELARIDPRGEALSARPRRGFRTRCNRRRRCGTPPGELAVADQVARRAAGAGDHRRADLPARLRQPRSWGSGRATRPSGRRGIAASRRSSATARSTASKTRAGAGDRADGQRRAGQARTRAAAVAPDSARAGPRAAPRAHA